MENWPRYFFAGLGLFLLFLFFRWVASLLKKEKFLFIQEVGNAMRVAKDKVLSMDVNDLINRANQRRGDKTSKKE